MATVRTAREILLELMALPTAPFVEGHVADHIRHFARKHGLALRADAAGNLVLRHRLAGERRTPRICFAAHMDHPGFVAEAMVARHRLAARWYGGVEPARFRDQGVRFWTSEATVSGRIHRVETEGKGPGRRVVRAFVRVQRAVERGAVGMWDLPDPEVRDGRCYARACDDLAGVAAILALLADLAKRKADADVTALLTRAEEAGFVGAAAAAQARTIPRTVPIFTLECSQALPDAPLGAGPIVRVGDRASIFTPELTDLATRAARDLAGQSKAFQYQRKLMDGGTCESTLYQQYAYRTTGLCLALGNYHNMTDDGGIGPEFIDLRDYDGLIALLGRIVDVVGETAPPTDGLRGALASRYEAGRDLLESGGL